MSSKSYKKNKEKVMIALGNKCARCGCEHDLQIDHIDPLIKKFDITKKLGCNLGSLWEEIHKCQLLCKPCHKEKTKEDHKSIQMKRNEFIHVNYRFDPILQEDVCDIIIDQYKKNGKAYTRICNFAAEKKGVDFWDIVKKHVKEYQNYQKFIYFKDWDELEISMSKDGKSMEEIKEMKDYLERENVKMKKEKPKLYQRFEQLSVGDDKGKSKSKSKCSFTKMVDNIIENDIDLFGV